VRRTTTNPKLMVVTNLHDEMRMHEPIVADVTVTLVPHSGIDRNDQNNRPKQIKHVSGRSVTFEERVLASPHTAW